MQSCTYLETTIGFITSLNGDGTLAVCSCIRILLHEGKSITDLRVYLELITDVDQVLNVKTQLEVRYMIILGMIDTLQVEAEVLREIVLSECANTEPSRCIAPFTEVKPDNIGTATHANSEITSLLSLCTQTEQGYT